MDTRSQEDAAGWPMASVKVASMNLWRWRGGHARTDLGHTTHRSIARPYALPDSGRPVVTTKGLVPLLQQGVPVFVFDVLGAAQTLPNAIPAVGASRAGGFDDEVQQQFGQFLQQVTRGNNEAALVFYCGGPQCWMSYNASPRAIELGYRNVLCYRGGLEAWQRAGLPLTPGRS